MSKIAFTKLGLKKLDNVKVISINNVQIEVKQYLPINEKLLLISRVINSAADENKFMNPVKLDLFGHLELMYAYTNITFTDKQKEDVGKLFDLLSENGVLTAVSDVIPESELDYIWGGINECAEAIYTYNNSVMGVLDNVSENYNELNLDTTDIAEKLSNPDNLTLVRDVLTKLG